MLRENSEEEWKTEKEESRKNTEKFFGMESKYKGVLSIATMHPAYCMFY